MRNISLIFSHSPMTDKMMSDQVYIFRFGVPEYQTVVLWYDHQGMTLMTWVWFLARSIFWNFKFQFLWYFHMFRGIYTHIWTEIITTTIAWWLCVSQLSSWSRVQFLSKSECPERSFGDIRNCWFDWCSLKRPRPWWGVRSGWL